jgi:crotonobetainyl-CoA:carnitine CoA-transferase CaiB-like acyl-CoA transferase
MTRVLEGIRVLDFSVYLSGPWCGMLLADMGAEVIRVEKPGGSEDRKLGPFAPSGDSLGVISTNRNKKGITLNLQSPKGRELLERLVKQADVLIENFGAPAKEALGLSYPALKELNPGIILVSISGYGQNGPLSHRPSFDPIAQALAGGMPYAGFPGAPPTRTPVQYVDFGTGMYAALGAIMALYHREKTGEGQMVDASLLDTAVSFVGGFGVAAEYKLTGHLRPQIGNHSFYTFADSFQARDGWVFISAASDSLWRRLCKALGREEMASDPRFCDNYHRFQNRQLIGPVVSQWVAERTVAEVVNYLEKARVPCAPINSVAEALENPQVQAREMLVEVDYPGIGAVPIGGLPIKLSETPGGIERRAPLVGEHNEEDYCGLLGLRREELASLKTEAVI